MDKKIIKQYLDQRFINEASETGVNGTPAIKLAKKIAKENKKINDAGVKEIGKDVKSSETEAKADPNQKTMATNKINYATDEQKEYHEEMEIMNGQEMIQLDNEPNEEYTKRAKEGIEGSSRMGNNPDWANVVAKGQGGDPDFGKNLAKKIKSSQNKRNKATPTTKMFGDDWEVTKSESHKEYANENTKNNKTQIKESMKRLKFKKEFKGVGNALKLIPEAYKVDAKVFEMTDGNESYKIRWEGSVNEGKAVVITAQNKTLVNEDIQRMKQLFNYKSEQTLGLVKGNDRINENKAFTDVLNKTKKIFTESEDIEGQDAEKEAPFEEADIKQAPEAKKHIEGTTSTDKGTQAPKPKTGEWDKISKPQAPEAKKHIEGSTSDDKGTQAPKPKTGEWDKAKPGHAAEAKKHIKENIDDEGEDVPQKKRADAYDASLDVADPEDMSASAADIKGAQSAPSVVNKDAIGGDEEDIDTSIGNERIVKLVSSKADGRKALKVIQNGQPRIVEIPPQFLDIAMAKPKLALAKIEAMEPVPAGDEDLMESIKKTLKIK